MRKTVNDLNKKLDELEDICYKSWVLCGGCRSIPDASYWSGVNDILNYILDNYGKEIFHFRELQEQFLKYQKEDYPL
jgi:hypothetical protein